MRKRKPKTTCLKKHIEKCNEIVRCYDRVQEVYADILQQDNHVVDVRCCVPFDDEEYGQYSSDFVCLKDTGEYMVRECCYRSQLLKPRMIKLLDFSQRYWRKNGISDWKVVVEKEDDHAKE